jgi:multicomponent Na+:H+ antiporter subunit E
MRTLFIHSAITLGVSWLLIIRFPDIFDDAFTDILLVIVIYALCWLSSYVYHRAYFHKVPKVVSLFFYFVKELVVASLKVAYDLVTPRHHMHPVVIALPLDVKTDLEITVLANLISLTPGTLSLDLSEDRTILYVHSVFDNKGDLEGLKLSIKNGFERRILEISR